MKGYIDIAIPIAWPDQTARGDERWMSYLKRVGLVKNLNFKVGHAAILLVNSKNGEIRYFDFGRYICPRGYGRARDQEFDPRLAISIKAQIENGRLINLEDILRSLALKESATHGGGRTLVSICYGISFDLALHNAERTVQIGPIPYGAIAPKHNSCSRYVAQILIAGLHRSDSRRKKLLLPESLKPSPTSNVVNAAKNCQVYFYVSGLLEKTTMTRLRSLKFQLDLLKDNFCTVNHEQLGDDAVPGFISTPTTKDQSLISAQWLGGIGEGKWFELKKIGSQYYILCYDLNGQREYCVRCEPDQDFDIHTEYHFTFDIHFMNHTVVQLQKKIVFHTVPAEDFLSQQAIQ